MATVFTGENGLVSVGAIVVPGSTTLTTTVFNGFERSIGIVVVVVVVLPGLMLVVVVVEGMVPDTTSAKHSFPGKYMRIGFGLGLVSVATGVGAASQSNDGNPSCATSMYCFQIRAGYIEPCTLAMPSCFTNSGMLTIGV